MIHPDTVAYNKAQGESDRQVCDLLASEIERALPEAENKIWHGHPVWFLDGNPVVGYNKLKMCVRLLFWSGQSFQNGGLRPEGKFKAAEVRYTFADVVDSKLLRKWLAEARKIQWDYKNIVKRKGKLELMEATAKPKSSVIEEYIKGFPPEVQIKLQQMHTTIKAAAPTAEEALAYRIPTFVLHENLVHFAGFKAHIGFYPAPSGIEKFKKELSHYKGAKGSVQFPLDEPLPLQLITRITKFRVKEALQRAKTRKV